MQLSLATVGTLPLTEQGHMAMNVMMPTASLTANQLKNKSGLKQGFPLFLVLVVIILGQFLQFPQVLEKS